MEVKAIESVKRLEEQLTAARESARAALLQTANDSLEQLKGIGYEYELKPKEVKKLGRPRKEKADGVVQQ